MTERADEDEEDSLDEQWQRLQAQKSPKSSRKSLIETVPAKKMSTADSESHLAAKQLSYMKGSCKRLQPHEMQVKVKQAVKKKPSETEKLGKMIHERATQSQQRLAEWTRSQKELQL